MLQECNFPLVQLRISVTEWDLDWFHGSRMEGFLSTFPPFTGPGCPALLPPGGSWAKREGRFLTPQGLNYLELVKAILSHHGGPVLPARRASTRECGVQVNGKADKVVQCSLGPKTLHNHAAVSPQSPQKVQQEQQQQVAGSTLMVGKPRFLRPVSIYSPVFDRRILLKKLSDGDSSDGEEEEQQQQEDEEEEATESDGEADPSGAEKDPKETFHQAYRGSNFQFLEQRYGFFHCKKCNIRWESAYVWCISGTSKVYYKQLCRKCQVGFNPYRVESILCKGCSQTCCSCKKKERHINMKRPHRQDLCCRCKGMRLSCDSTYSFKYIV